MLYALLGGKLGATLGTARGKNATASAGAHTVTETMFFGATTLIWLIGALCHNDTPKGSRAEATGHRTFTNLWFVNIRREAHRSRLLTP